MTVRGVGAFAVLALVVIVGTAVAASAKAPKLNPAAHALYSNLPRRTYPSCVGSTVTVKKDYASHPAEAADVPNIVAAVTCKRVTGTGAPYAVIFTQWQTDAAMVSFYTALRVDSQIQPDQGGPGNKCPQEGVVTINSAPLGRYLCYANFGASSYTWTIDELSIMGQAVKANDPTGALIRAWWLNSSPGPTVPTPPGSTTTSTIFGTFKP